MPHFSRRKSSGRCCNDQSHGRPGNLHELDRHHSYVTGLRYRGHPRRSADGGVNARVNDSNPSDAQR